MRNNNDTNNNNNNNNNNNSEIDVSDNNNNSETRKVSRPRAWPRKNFFRKLFKSIEWIKISKIPGNYLSKINTRTVRENILRERLG